MGLSHTVSGDIASFQTPSRVPIESLKFHFLPKQASGTPSPENPIPIEGWTGLNGQRAGKNLLPNNIVAGTEHSQGLTFVQNSDGSIRITGTGNNTTTKLAVIKNFPNGAFPLKAGTYRPHMWATDTTKSQIYISIMYNNGNNSMYCNANGNSYTYTIAEDVYVNQIRIGLQPSEDVEFDLTIYPSLEKNNEPTSWKPCRSELIPITFPDGETIYGGYADPVAGEIVAEYQELILGEDISPKINNRTSGYNYASNASGADGSAVIYFEMGWTSAQPQYGKYTCNYNKRSAAIMNKMKYNSYDATVIRYLAAEMNEGEFGFTKSTATFDPDGDGMVYCVLTVPSTCTSLAEAIEWLGQNPIKFYYPLKHPLHIPIAPQDLKAFLDHNNFWSDANNITEVTYAITESKDILATRKKAMDFDVGHHKKVQWNQLVKDGNFTGNSIDGARWRASHDTKGTISISNNIAEWECIEVPAYYYQAGITWTYGSNYNYLQIPYNHKLYIRVDMRCSKAVSGRIYALVANGMHKYSIAVPIEANTWTTIDGILPERVSTQTGEDDGIVKRFRTVIAGLNNMSDITVGTTYEVKNFMAFDLTQMFGLGNEPQTVAEFERICALNGIDLTTYQPYDTGSDRWLIVP